MPRHAHSPEDYDALARERCLTWVGPAVNGNHAKTSWRCESGHTFSSTYNKVQQKRGCPICKHHTPLAAEDFRRLADKMGWTWIGQATVSADEPTRWRCARGHEFERRYDNIRYSARKCPYCRELRSRSDMETWLDFSRFTLALWNRRAHTAHSEDTEEA